MPTEPDTADVAAALRESVGLLLRRMRQHVPGELTLPENAAVARHPDPEDGRRVVLSLTGAGQRILQDKRNARTRQLAEALSTRFTPDEVRQLAEAAPLLGRLAQCI
jgi:hypothetical protein